MNWQVKRLVSEWLQHGTLIIACDFDDTIAPFKLDDGLHTFRYRRTIDLLRRCQSVGAEIIINTSSAPDRFDEMLSYCRDRGLVVTGVNQNSPGLTYGHHGKVYANIYLDDRSGIDQSLQILEDAIEEVAQKRTSHAQPA